VRVVAVVFVEPPAIGEAGQQVGVHEPDDVVPAAASTHLPMPGVMADKGQLGEDERQERSHNELPPAVPKPKEGDDANGEQRQVSADLGGVVAGSPLEQPGVAHHPGKLGVLPATRTYAARSASDGGVVIGPVHSSSVEDRRLGGTDGRREDARTLPVPPDGLVPWAPAERKE
jgi:hypothetical protein